MLGVCGEGRPLLVFEQPWAVLFMEHTDIARTHGSRSSESLQSAPNLRISAFGVGAGQKQGMGPQKGFPKGDSYDFGLPSVDMTGAAPTATGAHRGAKWVKVVGWKLRSPAHNKGPSCGAWCRECHNPGEVAKSS